MIYQVVFVRRRHPLYTIPSKQKEQSLHMPGEPLYELASIEGQWYDIDEAYSAAIKAGALHYKMMKYMKKA